MPGAEILGFPRQSDEDRGPHYRVYATSVAFMYTLFLGSPGHLPYGCPCNERLFRLMPTGVRRGQGSKERPRQIGPGIKRED